MATGILAVLDDISMLADDISIASKIATKKTAGILGDDLAVNAQKATGFDQSRELKVIWAITKGSFVNKIIILPIAFILSYFAPWLIVYILILGGLYLLYEGAEKVFEFIFHKNNASEKNEIKNATKENILEIEKKKIKSAIFTDFILSIEIVIIALGTVIEQELIVRVFATTLVAFLATIFVYGVVALIVRIDNVGFYLIDKGKHSFGNFLIALMPKLINVLSIIGTIAMVLVGGGILMHNIEFFHHFNLDFLPSIINELIFGFILGFIIVIVSLPIKKLIIKTKS